MMIRFTPKLILAWILIGAWGFFLSPKAAHAVTVTGTDIRVDYIGTVGPTDLTYRVTVVIYTECDNSGTIALRPTADITVSSMSNSISMNMTLQRVATQAGDTITPVCPNVTPRSSCNDPSLISARPGYIKNTYTGIISLPARANDWVFYYFHLGNGRGNSSMNLCDGMIMHVAALCYFDNLEHYDNSSPRFTTDPVHYLNVNQPSKIFNGPVDPNLDSLVTTPYSSLGCLTFNGAICPTCGFYSEVTYLPGMGYTVNDPISTLNGYYVNPRSGTASFVPQTPGSFAFGFKCEEYDRRTGKSLGYVIRDIAMPVMYYTGGAFTIDSLPSAINGAIAAPSGSSDLVVCPGTSMSFDIGAQSTSDPLYLSAERPTATGSTFTVTGNGTAAPKGRFSWTPGINDLGTHIIRVNAVDSSCNNPQYPLVHEQYTIITIHVIGGIELGPDRNYCALEGTPLMLAPETVIPGITYQWTALDGSAPAYMNDPHTDHPLATPPQTTTYVISTKGLPATCKSKDTLTVFVDTSAVTITPGSPVILCNGEHIDLDANATGLPPRQNFPCDLTGSLPNTPLDSISPKPLNGILQSGNNPQSTPFNELTTSRHQYLIRASDLLAAGMQSGTLTGMNFFISGNASGASFNDFKIYLKCTPFTALDANAFEQGSVPVYAASSLAVPASGILHIDFDAWYNWDTTQNLIVEICFTKRSGNTAVFTDFYPTIYTSCLYTSNASGNSVCGGGVGSTGPTAVNELPRMEFYYHPAPDADFQYAWLRLMGNYLSDTAAKSPSIDIDQRTKYYVTTYGRSGCLLRDSFDVFVSDRHFTVQPKDTSICIGDTAILAASGGAYYQWYEDNFTPATSLGCVDCDTVPAFPVKNTAYTVVINDSFHCADTLKLNVSVLTRSAVNILNNDTTIRYGESVQLEAVGAQQYIWSPSDYLSNAGIHNPIATPRESILYIVTGSSSGICKSFDSIRINVNLQGDALIPSAFSPNGDGLNDVFKIENLNFRKIVTFKVFNRFGQEVYSAPTGNDKGWDGTWKGVPADKGTYFYQIQLALPDGRNENYTGDVTLIR